MRKWADTYVALSLKDRIKMLFAGRLPLDEEMIVEGCVGFVPVFDDAELAEAYVVNEAPGAQMVTAEGMP